MIVELNATIFILILNFNILSPPIKIIRKAKTPDTAMCYL